MAHLLPVYLLAAGMALAVIILAARSDESTARGLSKIRVRVDDSRRGRSPEPPEDEFDSHSGIEKMALVVFLLLLVILMGGVR